MSFVSGRRLLLGRLQIADEAEFVGVVGVAEVALAMLREAELAVEGVGLREACVAAESELATAGGAGEVDRHFSQALAPAGAAGAWVDVEGLQFAGIGMEDYAARRDDFARVLDDPELAGVLAEVAAGFDQVRLVELDAEDAVVLGVDEGDEGVD